MSDPITHPMSTDLTSKLDEIERLRLFAKELITTAFTGDIDWQTVHDEALKHGLIIEVAYDPNRHGPNDVDAEEGAPWMELAPFVKEPEALARLGMRSEAVTDDMVERAAEALSRLEFWDGLTACNATLQGRFMMQARAALTAALGSTP